MKRLRDTNYGTGSPSGEGHGGRRLEKRTDRRRNRKAPTRPIRVLGIVGGMGSGKSRVAQLLAKRGATVIDADSVGHALLDQGPVQETLVRKFGTDILGPDLGEGTRQIDRRALGAIVFANDDARKALEESLHPRMRTTFERVISRLSRQVSPKPGALTAHTLTIPRILLTTNVAKASPSTSSAIINNGRPDFATPSNTDNISRMLEIFLSTNRM